MRRRWPVLLGATLALAVGSVGVVLWWPVAHRHVDEATSSPAPSATAAVDPLDAAELAAATRLIHADPRFPAGAWFATVDRVEPEKALVLSGGHVPRRAVAIVLDAAGKRTLQIEVDLDAAAIVDWQEVAGQPPVLLEEYGLVGEIVRADPRWQGAMRARGITDFAKVQVDGWAAGPYAGARVLRAISYLQGDRVNYYGRPIEGVVALVDMNEHRVIDLVDRGAVPLPPPSQDFSPEALGPPRRALPPLEIRQPEGVGYTRDGWEVAWDQWRFRFGFHPREGLVLRDVRLVDGDRERGLMYRGSLSEMAVPYADPTEGTWSWRAAFDVGEYGLGNLATTLTPGVDVPDNAELVDVVTVDGAGDVVPMPGIVAIYERDGGVAWRHYDWTTGDNVGRRSRELVVAFAAAVGNYDYLFHWVFQQDGTLSMEIELTGVLLARGTADARTPDRIGCPGCTGHLVAPNIEAPNHQHFFAFRLDLDVDGPANTVLEADVEAIPVSAGNPDGNAFAKHEHPLVRESLAQRDADARASRMWRVVNPGVRNDLGNTVGTMLMPHGNAVPYLAEGNTTRARAAFVGHPLWVTRYRDGELWAAGAWPNQSTADDGLSRFVADDEPLEGEDVVVWYVVGLTHLPREEEWPIMDTHHAGFTLEPAGFFARNPTLDLPAD